VAFQPPKTPPSDAADEVSAAGGRGGGGPACGGGGGGAPAPFATGAEAAPKLWNLQREKRHRQTRLCYRVLLIFFQCKSIQVLLSMLLL